MTKVTIWTGLAGLLVGSAVSLLAHGASGFQTGPVVFFGLVISTLGGLGAGVLVLAMGKRNLIVSGIGAFSLAMLLALVLIPIIWPYPSPSGPVPLEGRSGSEPK